MPDFKTMIKGMEEKETPETPTQEETEKAGKLADSGFKIGEHRFIGKDNNKTNPGFIAYGGNNPDQKLSTKELAKIYDEQQKAKSVPSEQDRLTKLKKDAIAESQATAKKEAPLADKPKNTPWEDSDKRVKEADAKYKPIYDEMDKEDDEIYKAYWYETDPNKKAQLKAQLDEHGKKIDALIEEWEQAAGFGKKEAPLAQKPKTRKVGNEEFPAPQKAQYQESRFLKDDPYYKLIKEKSPMSYREHLYYPENGKFALHDTEGNKIGEFDDEENTLAAIDNRYSDKAEDIMAEYRDIKQDDIPEAIRQLEEKKKTAKTDEEWERYDEQARLLRRDWEENYGREPEPRLLKPTDDFTDAEIKNFLDYLFYTNIDQGYTYEKTPQGDYYTNLVAGDPEAEPVVVNEEQLKGFLRNSLQNVDNLAQNLYEWQIDNQ